MKLQWEEIRWMLGWVGKGPLDVLWSWYKKMGTAVLSAEWRPFSTPTTDLWAHHRYVVFSYMFHGGKSLCARAAGWPVGLLCLR